MSNVNLWTMVGCLAVLLVGVIFSVDGTFANIFSNVIARCRPLLTNQTAATRAESKAPVAQKAPVADFWLDGDFYDEVAEEELLDRIDPRRKTQPLHRDCQVPIVKLDTVEQVSEARHAALESQTAEVDQRMRRVLAIFQAAEAAKREEEARKAAAEASAKECTVLALRPTAEHTQLVVYRRMPRLADLFSEGRHPVGKMSLKEAKVLCNTEDCQRISLALAARGASWDNTQLAVEFVKRSGGYWLKLSTPCRAAKS